MKEKLELLAEIQHEIWSAWMKYMFENGGKFIDNYWSMYDDEVERWIGQMNTPYKILTEKEKQSDRDVVKEFRIIERLEEAGDDGPEKAD